MVYQNLDSNLSKEKRKAIFLEFTKELIRQSGGDIFKLENMLEDESIEEKKEKRLAKPINKKERVKKIPEKESDDGLTKDLNFPRRSKSFSSNRPPPSLFIPRPKLPPRFQYLKPVPTNVEIDLGSLNTLIKDPLVRSVECSGPNQNIFVDGTMGRRKTNIVLTKEEIDGIVRKFSEKAKIPPNEGVFRVVVGRLIFSAIISNVIGSKFTIKKMIYEPGFSPGR